jgi:hypothetical protein
MTVSFEGFELGSYLLGVGTPIVLAFVYAFVVSMKQAIRKKRR